LVAANCCVTPVGNPLTVTVAELLAPVMLTVNGAAVPSCGARTFVLPNVTVMAVCVELEPLPPPHPASVMARPKKLTPTTKRSNRTWNIMNKPLRQEPV
jgi:hypothetical protein